MKYDVEIIPRTLHFKRPAGTSRGTYTTRQSWFVRLTSDECPGIAGIGECAPLPSLSCDDFRDVTQILQVTNRLRLGNEPFDNGSLRDYPSLLFGLETAMRQLEQGGTWRLWDTPFTRGESGIAINGLIWMGDYKRMREQIEEKLRAGYRCVKLKIGAIDFEEELNLLRYIRSHFSAKEIELRVDANGAFSPHDAMERLKRLAELDLHSIEQPIRAGQWEEMARLTADTPLPIALDEELIGHNRPEEKKRLLETIRPQYIVLKPSLHGGLSGCEEWIRLADTLLGNTPTPRWWITSALESNIGLNAIAQWCSTLANPLPQGLGTGLLFTDNLPMPLHIQGDCLRFDPAGPFPTTEEARG